MQAEQETLDIHLIALLAAAQVSDDQKLVMPTELSEQRLATPGSGLYAALFDAQGNKVWESVSGLGRVIPWLNTVSVGSRQFATLQLADAQALQSYSLGVNWSFENNVNRVYTFHVAESLDGYNAQVSRFRRQLFGWFAAIGLALLFALGLILRKLLKPLSQIEDEIRAVEQGERERLSTNYPSELRGVARNLNGLVDRERNRGDLYRRTLGDLAHSLKTPLATLKTQLGVAASNDVSKELDRIDEIIRYQLAKPSTRGRTIGSQPVDVEPLVAELNSSFAKIYHDRQVKADVRIAPGLQFRGDRGDLLELIGNILDNAFKRARTKVSLDANRNEAGHFCLRVDDDGPGFPEGSEAHLLERGKRLDEVPQSQGIGLSIVAEILSVYEADMQLERSDWGGARVRVLIPTQ